MSGRNRDEEISLELVSLRQQLYDSIANDALSLLNIQLLSLPITLSLISLLLTLFVRDSGNVSQIGEQISRAADIPLIITGLLTLSASILWTVFLYYYSKKYAHQAPNQFIDTLTVNNSRDNHSSEHKYPVDIVLTHINQKFRPVRDIAEKAELDIRSETGKYHRFDEISSKERLLRQSSVLAVVSTVLGILLVVIGLTKSVIPYADSLSLLIIFYVVIFLPGMVALVYIVDMLTLVILPIRFIYKFLTGIIEILSASFEEKYEREIEMDIIGTSIATIAGFSICVCILIWSIWEIESLKFITSYLSVVAISKTL